MVLAGVCPQAQFLDSHVDDPVARPQLAAELSQVQVVAQR